MSNDLTNHWTIEDIQNLLGGSLKLPLTRELATQLLAVMQRERKLREAMQKISHGKVWTDIDPTGDNETAEGYAPSEEAEIAIYILKELYPSE